MGNTYYLWNLWIKGTSTLSCHERICENHTVKMLNRIESQVIHNRVSSCILGYIRAYVHARLVFLFFIPSKARVSLYAINRL